MINIDDFTKVDLRVARVVAAEEVPKAKKLIKLTLSLGGDQQRTVFAGIESAYEPAALVGRLVICVANLAPRQMTFGISEGMVVLDAVHGCVTMRGSRQTRSSTVTIAARGVLADPVERAEVIALIGGAA